MNRKVLFTGGSGLLGREMQTLLSDALFPTHNEFDITAPDNMEAYLKDKEIDILIHAAAFTSPPKIDEDPVKALSSNIIGTANVVKLCMAKNIKLIYICTDYVFDGKKGEYKEDDPMFPVNKYAWSKLGGECAVRLYDNSLIIRTSFSQNEFPYPKAFTDQWTSRIPVSDLANILTKLIKTDYTGTLHIGSERKSVYDYAKWISPEKEIGELSLKDVSFIAPVDTSLNIDRLNNILSN